MGVLFSVEPEKLVGFSDCRNDLDDLNDFRMDLEASPKP